MDPVNPSGCRSSWSGGVATTVGASPEGPSIQIGLSYSVTVEPYKLSINVPSTYPETHWVFDPCSIQYGNAWKGEATIMYVTTSSSPVTIRIIVGAV